MRFSAYSYTNISDVIENAVSSFHTEYYQSTSNTELIGGKWSTTIPPWENGKYYWQKTITTFSDPNKAPIETKPVCVTGGIGSDGRGIKSIIPEYAKNTNGTTAPVSGWSSSRPTWNQREYIWTRFKITYNDGSNPEYTTPTCDSSWEAMNNLEIGGRNLLKSTSSITGYKPDQRNWNWGNWGTVLTNTTDTATDSIHIVTPGGDIDINSGVSFYANDIKYQKGEHYTFSIAIRGTYNPTDKFVAHIWYETATSNKYDSSSTTSWIDNQDGINDGISSVIFQRRFISFKIPNDFDESKNKLKIIISCKKMDILLCRPQLEKGNKSTDWKRAEEDIQEQFSSVIKTLSGVSSKVDTVEGKITNKVWQTDINTAVNNYDGTTVKSIRDKISQQEQTINGFNQTVKDMQTTIATKADGSTVETIKKNMSSLTQDLSGFKTTVESTYATNDNLKNNYFTKTETQQLADKIYWIVSDSSTSSSLTLTSQALTAMTNQFVVKSPDGKRVVIQKGQILLDALKSNNYSAPTSSTGIYAAAGTFYDLSNGSITSKNFVLDSNGNAYLKGTVYATSGIIGGCQISGGKLIIPTANITGTLSADKIVVGSGNLTTNLDSIKNQITIAQNSANKAISLTQEEFYSSTSPTALSGGSWQTTQPAWKQGQYIWRRTKITYVDSSKNPTYEPSTTGVCITGNTGATGSTGNAGKSVATVYLYQRKTSTPSKPTNTLTFTFSTGVLSGSINNGWSTTIPSGNNPLYVISAIASSSSATDAIAASDWSSPVILSQNGATGAKGDTGTTLANGTSLYTDSYFANGTNGLSVYNNSSNTNVSITRQAKSSDNPYKEAKYEVMVKTIGTASPGLGGVVQRIDSRANAVFVRRVIAKIPTGYSIKQAENSMGTGYKTEWLTSRTGTGRFTEYIYRYTCGASGSFSNGGHMYIEGAAATSDKPVTWYIASCETYDMNAKSDIIKAQEKANEAAATILNWCWQNNQTYIDGKNIYTGTVTAKQLSADALKSNNYVDPTTSTGGYATAGTYYNLTNGSIISKNLLLDSNGNISLRGNITANSLTLGSNVSISSSKVTGLSSVATSGKYTDLTGTPNLSVYIQKDGTIGSTPGNGVTGFKVSSSGLLSASNAVIYGSVYASAGVIGGCSISNGKLIVPTANISGTLTADKIIVGGSGLDSQWNTLSGKVTTAQTTANNAAKTATNFIKVDGTGIMVADLAKGTGNNIFIDSDSVDIRNGTSVLGSFSGNNIYLGKGGQEVSSIYLCGDKGSIYYWDTGMSFDDDPIFTDNVNEPNTLHIISDHYIKMQGKGSVLIRSDNDEYMANLVAQSTNLQKDAIAYMSSSTPGTKEAASVSTYVATSGSISHVSIGVENNSDSTETIFNHNSLRMSISSVDIINFGKSYSAIISTDGTNKNYMELKPTQVLFPKKILTNDGFQTGGCIDTFKNNILWSGAWYMSAGHTVTLSQSVQSQPHGIVLVFSPYEGGSKNNNWQAFFLAKKFIADQQNQTHTFSLFGDQFAKPGTKYMSINNTQIKGHDDNTKSGTSATSGIKYQNGFWVLRYVYGV